MKPKIRQSKLMIKKHNKARKMPSLKSHITTYKYEFVQIWKLKPLPNFFMIHTLKSSDFFVQSCLRNHEEAAMEFKMANKPSSIVASARHFVPANSPFRFGLLLELHSVNIMKRVKSEKDGLRAYGPDGKSSPDHTRGRMVVGNNGWLFQEIPAMVFNPYGINITAARSCFCLVFQNKWTSSWFHVLPSINVGPSHPHIKWSLKEDEKNYQVNFHWNRPWQMLLVDFFLDWSWINGICRNKR